MKKNSGNVVWRSLLFNSFVVSGILSFKCDRAFSQITPDNTLGDESSVVNSRDANSESIDGGAVRGQNLFHSFEEFNVGEDRGVYFANPDAVTNIFSRVTGNDVSNILGTLGVDGAANLFLINPNGIVFGEGASLDLQGSFAATTADGIEFGEQGFFSAVNPTESVLTISVPLGLQFGSNPGSIINRSSVPDNTGDNVGLQVPAGENLTLVGGDVLFDGGEVTARGGNIEIDAIGAAGTVSFNDNGSLSFPENVVRADVTFSNAFDVDVTGTGGGNININANNVTLEGKYFGENSESTIRAGITADSISTEAQAGEININATGEVSLVKESRIQNNVEIGGTGNSGNVNITTGSLFVNNGVQIQSLTEGKGNSGKVVINASDTVSFDGRNDNGFPSGVFSIVDQEAKGNAGGIDIFARSFSITNRAQFGSYTLGAGDAGDINIQVEEDVKLVNSIIISEIVEGTGVGKGGNITIKTGSLLLQDGSALLADTENIGNAGDINIEAREKVLIEGSGPAALDPNQIIESQITATVDRGAKGKGGNINISTPFLSVADGGFIRSSTFGLGNAGNVKINANNIFVNGFDNNDDSSSLIASEVNSVDEIKSESNGGDVEIITDNLSVTNGAKISTSTFGQGSAGNLSILANNIKIDGEENGILTGFFASVEEGATGQGGSINIGSLSFSTQQLILNNGGQIVANTFGQGDAGNLSIFADNFEISGRGVFPSGLFAEVREDATGRGGSINIGSEQSFVEQLNITNGAKISVSSLGQGKAGQLKINANALNLDNNAVISSQSESTFEAGDITLNIANSLQAKDSEISTSSTQSSGGILTIASGDIQLRGNSDVTTNIFSGEGSGGNIAIKADSVIAFDDSDIFAFAADGRGGNITLDTPAFFAENFTLNSLTAENTQLLENNNRADVNATGNQPGLVSVPDVSFIQNSLTELENNSINTDELVANSCVSPVGDRQQGKFIITGGQSLPVRPGDGIPSKYPTGEVRNVPESNHSSWRSGDPIVEPQGAYRLANGKLVLSRECSN